MKTLHLFNDYRLSPTSWFAFCTLVIGLGITGKGFAIDYRYEDQQNQSFENDNSLWKLSIGNNNSSQFMRAPGDIFTRQYATESDAQSSARTDTLSVALTGHPQIHLSFDPTLARKICKTNLRMPLSRVRLDNFKQGERPLRGEGEINFDENNAWSLSVRSKLWPKL